MRHRLLLGSTVAIGASLVGLSVCGVGCSSSSSTATTPPGHDGGSPETGTPETSTPDTSTPEASTPDQSVPCDGNACCTGTIYSRLGGHAGIRAAVDTVVSAELMNTDIASYFFNQPGAPGNGHPTPDQIAECFTDLIGSKAGGPETYPASVTDDAGTYMCKTMSAIHQPLMISGGTFSQFIVIAAGAITSLNDGGGICPADLTALGGALEMTESAIVTASLADAGLEPYPGDGG